MYSSKYFQVKVFSLFILLFNWSLVYATTSYYGNVKSNFDVSASGAATYTVPIESAPGIKGLKPHVALVYSSQSGNGTVGLGWSVSGVSAIVRCKKNLGDNGVVRGVNLVSTDAYCYNGSQLVAINGSYGANGTEYKTKIDDFKKIFSYGDSGFGPDYFVVQAPDGKTLEFGNTPDSKYRVSVTSGLGAGRQPVVSWKINKISDEFSNTVNFSYFSDVTTGQHFINNISYGYINGTPLHHITFFYDSARTDIIENYIQGAHIKVDSILSRIEVTKNKEIQHTYDLVYGLSPGTERSTLTSIEQCIPDGQCRGLLEYTWQNTGSRDFSAATHEVDNFGYVAGGGWRTSIHPRFMVDVNADGRSDVVGIGDSSVSVSLATENGFLPTKNWLSAFGDKSPGWSTGRHPKKMADVDGDGRADVVGFGEDGVYIAQATGVSFKSPSKWVTHFGFADVAGGWRVGEHPRMMADVNGDGRADIVGFANRGAVVSLSRGNTFSLPKLWLGQFGYVAGGWRSSIHPRFLSDVNGDGRDDIVGIGDSGISVALAGDESFSTAENWGSYYGDKISGWDTANHPKMMADVNADGMQDIVAFGDNGVYVSLSTGKNFTPPALWNNQFGASTASGGWTTGRYPRTMSDVNGDGKADVVGFGHYGVNVALSTGHSFSTSKIWIAHYGFAVGGGWRIGEHPRMMADVNGDGLQDVVGFANAGVLVSKSNIQHDYIQSFSNSVGHKTTVTMLPLTNKTVYSRLWGAIYPMINLQMPMYVVGQVDNSLDGGKNIYRTLNYRYQGARFDQKYNRFLGFSTRYATEKHQDSKAKTHQHSDITTMTSYKQYYPFIGMPVVTEQQLSNGSIINRTVNYYAYLGSLSGGHVHPYVKKSTQDWCKESIYNSMCAPNQAGHYRRAIIEQTDTTAYGEANQIVETLEAANNVSVYKKTTNNRYADPNQYGIYRVGVKLSVNVIEDDFTNSVNTVSTTFDYFSGSGTLKTKERYPDVLGNDIESIYLKTEYTYDNYGNQITASVSGDPSAKHPVTARYSSANYTYLANGDLQIDITNANRETETKVLDGFFGSLLSLTGPNGRTSYKQYNGFGQLMKDQEPDGNSTDSKYFLCDSSNLPMACSGFDEAYYVYTAKSGGTDNYSFYDRLGREVRTRFKGFNNTDIEKVVRYNERGQTIFESENHLPGATTVKGTSYFYDDFGRLTKVEKPADQGQLDVSIKSYDGLNTELTRTRLGANGTTELKTTQISDVRGLLKSVTDSGGNVTTYSHGIGGNITGISDSNGNEIISRFDRIGRKTYMNDPDMGEWVYEFDTFNNVRKQTDAKGQSFTSEYDALDRMIKSRDISTGSDTTWQYYSTTDSPAGRLIGALKRVYRSADGYTENYIYNDNGFLSSTRITINGTEYVIGNDYDQFARISAITYPSRYNGEKFKVRNVYDAHGYLMKVVDGNDTAAEPAAYWTAFLANPKGEITMEALGNGLVTTRKFSPESGKLLGITTGLNNAIQDLKFSYDTLGNLESRTDNNMKFASDVGVTESFMYDDLNRLTSATLNGIAYKDYAYDALGNITQKTNVGSYQYDQINNAGPHAVTSIDNGTKFQYDKNGNLLSGRNRLYTYNSYNRPIAISRNGKTSNFVYDPSQALLQKEDVTTKTTYIGKLYKYVTDKTTNSSSETYQVYVAGRIVASVTPKNNVVAATPTNKPKITGMIDTWYRSVTIQGENILSATEVKLGGVKTGFYVARGTYDSFLIADLPSGFTSGKITVTTASGTSESSENFTTKFNNPGVTGVHYFGYGTGAVLGFSGKLEIYGLGLRDVTQVVVDNIVAPILSKQDTMMVVDLSANQTPGKITLKSAQFPDVTSSGTASASVTVATNEIVYFLSDHLGSTYAITDSTGAVKERFNYSPFGERISGSWNDGYLAQLTSSVSDIGFTGHEMLDDLGLVHMNGRVYDPELGRFISADPFIQYGDYSQSYNRYSYVLNNPLSQIDPTGFYNWKDLEEDLKKPEVVGTLEIIAGIALIAVEIICNWCTGGAAFTTGGSLIGDGLCNFGVTEGCEIRNEFTSNGIGGCIGNCAGPTDVEPLVLSEPESVPAFTDYDNASIIAEQSAWAGAIFAKARRDEILLAEAKGLKDSEFFPSSPPPIKGDTWERIADTTTVVTLGPGIGHYGVATLSSPINQSAASFLRLTHRIKGYQDGVVGYYKFTGYAIMGGTSRGSPVDGGVYRSSIDFNTVNGPAEIREAFDKKIVVFASVSEIIDPTLTIGKYMFRSKQVNGAPFVGLTVTSGTFNITSITFERGCIKCSPGTVVK